MPNENSSPNSPAPQNITYFSDGNLLRDMGRVEARLDAHDREFKECKDDLKIVKESVAKLKEWKAFIIGGAIVVAAVASWVTSLILKYLG